MVMEHLGDEISDCGFVVSGMLEAESTMPSLQDRSIHPIDSANDPMIRFTTSKPAVSSWSLSHLRNLISADLSNFPTLNSLDQGE
jgi:hypothetical protein